MSSVNALLHDLVGVDPLRGKEALEELQQLNLSDVPAVFKAVLQAPDRTQHGVDRLAKLCAHLGSEAASFLAKEIETANWDVQGLAAQCFKYVRNQDAETALGRLVEGSRIFDVQRHAISALGETGSDGWSRSIIEATLGKGEQFSTPDRYTAGKLAWYAAEALAKMVVREDEESQVSYDLFNLDSFLQRIWNKGKIKELYGPGESEIKRAVVGGLRDITPTAATPLQKVWLHGSWVVEQALAAEALYNMPLDRVANELAKCLLDVTYDEDVRHQCAISLMGFSTPQASRCLIPALPLYFQANSSVARAILWAYSGLFFFEPPGRRDDRILDAILNAGGEPKAQLIYGYGIWLQHPELIEAAMSDSDAFTRAVAALALARSRGGDAIPKLRSLRRDAATPLERLFSTTALAVAGEEGSPMSLHEELCKHRAASTIPMLRHIWKREIVSALSLNSLASTPASIAWAEVLKVDINRCMEEMEAIAILSKHSASLGTGKTKEKEAKVTSVSGVPKRGPVIFVSYSHEDDKWRKKLERVLSPLIQGQELDLWTDTKIDPGAKWKEEIQKVLETADVAVLLVTQAFLASDFISKHELPPLLERGRTRGLRILWIPISDSLFNKTEIASYQAVIDPKKPLDTFKGPKLNGKLVEIANVITQAVQNVRNARA